MRRHTPALALLALALTACSGGDQDAGQTDPTNETPTSAGGTTTAAEGPATPTDTGTELELVQCENPEGYALSYPQDWEVNSGDVVPECSQFNPTEFEVPWGTDERVAAITSWVDPVPFDVASDPETATDLQRETLTVSGRDAVRLEYETGGDGLWPAGTPITMYVVDVSTGEEDRTLFLDTIGVGDFSYEDNQAVLDRMAETLSVQ